MTVTSTRVSFGFYAMEVKQDSTPTCSDKQTFSKMNDLVVDNVSPRPYITFEPDYWLLSGGYRFMSEIEESVHVGLMSLSMSDENGDFDTPPQLVVDFSEVQSIDSLTLLFDAYTNDYASDIDVEYYNATYSLISSTNYTPDTFEFATEDSAANFKQIKITFNSTNNPYRYLRLKGIDYGELVTFDSSTIISASIIEQVDPMSITVPSNSLDLSVYSTDAQFSMINPTGDYSALQYNQQLSVYEYVDGNLIYFGNYYLDDWSNPSDYVINMKAIDLIGILDGEPYRGGLWAASDITLSELLEDMFDAIDTPYDLDTILYDVPVVGWIPITTYREALQQLAFMAGAYVSCSRSGVIQIYKSKLLSDVWSAEYTVTKAMKGMDDQSLTQKALVTGVEIKSHNYVENTTSTELYNGTLAAGTHTITFENPVHDLSVTGASISSSGANYAVLSVSAAVTVVLTGLGYTDTSQVYGVYTQGLGSNVKSNVLSITNATLVNRSNVAEITQRIYDYYQQRYLQKVKLFAPTAEVGKSVVIDTLYNQEILGIVEKMNINLSGGFVSDTEIVGVVNG